MTTLEDMSSMSRPALLASSLRSGYEFISCQTPGPVLSDTLNARFWRCIVVKLNGNIGTLTCCNAGRTTAAERSREVSTE